MLSHFAVNLPGPSHIDHGVVCQDSYSVAHVGKVAILAVADGIGSESQSDIGSRIAANTFVHYCKKGVEGCADPEGRLDLMRSAFYAADDAITDAALNDENLSTSQMHTTLCAVIWDSESGIAWVGQSGDSGALCAHFDGTYELMTRQQNDEEGRVYHLGFDDRWTFAEFEGVASVALCTDGVLEALFAPPFLQRFLHIPEANRGLPFDASTLRPWLEPRLNPAEANPVLAFERAATEFLAGYNRNTLDDDKTVLVAFDPERPPATLPESYYEPPRWELVDRLRIQEYDTDGQGADALEPDDAAYGQEETTSTRLDDAPGLTSEPGVSPYDDPSKLARKDVGGTTEHASRPKRPSAKNRQPGLVSNALHDALEFLCAPAKGTSKSNPHEILEGDEATPKSPRHHGKHEKPEEYL